MGNSCLALPALGFIKELNGPIVLGVDPANPGACNPTLAAALSLEYWTHPLGQSWRRLSSRQL